MIKELIPKNIYIIGNYFPVHTLVTLSYIYSWLSRCSTDRGSSTGLSPVGPTKVEAYKTFLFTEGSLKVENNPRRRFDPPEAESGNCV